MSYATPRSETLAAAGLAALLFIVYAAGASRTIYVGDSGELTTAVYLLGIPHPSGYPLYVMLGKLWTLLVPVGSIAFRMSLFSAACAAVACGALYRFCRWLGLHVVAATTSALLLAFGPSFWSQANIQRVYALNAVFVVFATWAAFAWHRNRDRRLLALALFLSGLGTCNHLFMAVGGVAVAMFAIVTQPELLREPRALLKGAAAFGVGLLPYLYLPLRSRADPRLDWGNPETLSNFVDVVLRQNMWRTWIEGPTDVLVVLADFLHSIASELFWIGVALAIIGLLVGQRNRWPVLLPLLVIAGNVVTVLIHGERSAIFIWHRYYIPSYLMAALLAGMGLHWLLERLPRRARLLPLALPAVMLIVGWNDFDRSRYRVAEDFSLTLLDTLPPGAHLAASDDNVLFVLIYLHLVEGLRPDVDLILQGVGGAAPPPLRFDPDREPLYFTHHPNWNMPQLEIVPYGLVYQVVRAGRPAPIPPVVKDRLDGEDDPRVPKGYLTQNLIGGFHYMLGVSSTSTDWARAESEFAAARAAAPNNDVLFYNLGLIYRRAGLLSEALASFERAHQINPRYLTGARRVKAYDRVLEVRAELARTSSIEESLDAAVVRAGTSPGAPQELNPAQAGGKLRRW